MQEKKLLHSPLLQFSRERVAVDLQDLGGIADAVVARVEHAQVMAALGLRGAEVDIVRGPVWSKNSAGREIGQFDR